MELQDLLALEPGAADRFSSLWLGYTLLLPGTLYSDGSNSFRIGFGRRNMPESLQQLDRHLRKIRSDKDDKTS